MSTIEKNRVALEVIKEILKDDPSLDSIQDVVDILNECIGETS